MASLQLCIITFVLLIFVLIGIQAQEDDDFPDKSGGSICPKASDRVGCTINCFRSDPVCGANGVTYFCGCPEAACNGARVVHKGPCATRSAGSAFVPGQVLLLIHIVWLFVLGLSLLVGVF